MGIMIVMVIFELIFMLVPIGIVIFVIVGIVKGVKNTNNMQNGNNNYPGQPMMNNNGNPNRYSTINSHYSQQTLNGGGNVSYVPVRGDHEHAYEHKVQPIEEASVHEMFEDRKEAYIERKQQMKADLPKTSYSKMEEINQGYVMSNMQNSYNNYGQNGDMASASNRSEENVTCKYCGAQNIVPRSRDKEYKCYFCREVI